MIIYGVNKTGSTSYTDCWPQNTVRTLPTTAVILGVSSADAKDTAAGVGARTIRVGYLDGSYDLKFETLTLSGQTKVVTTGYALRVLFAEVLTVGSELDNAGIIYIYDTSDTVTSGVPQTATKIFGHLSAGDNVMKLGMWTVPAGCTWRIKRLTVAGYDNTTTAKTVAAQIQVRPYGRDTWLTYELPATTSGGASGQGFFCWEPKTGGVTSVFTEKTDVRLQAKNSAASLWMAIAEIEES